MRPSLVPAAAVVIGLAAAPGAGSASPGAATTSTTPDLVRCLAAPTRQGDFAAASRAATVPRGVLLAVSYVESRWDDHGGQPSTAGGYGPMHLTDLPVATESDGRGDGSVRRPRGSTQTMRLAHRRTGLDRSSLRTAPAANICGGAAVLAHFQQAAGHSLTAGPLGWADAVERYSGSGDAVSAGRFVQQVYRVLRSGAARTTNDGQRIRLAAHPRLRQPASDGTTSTGRTPTPDCPAALGCWWVAAPYRWYGRPDPSAYGNHDLANRPRDLSIDYIVIHDTEGSFDTALNLVTDPRYVSWQYTIRSSDGQVAQHVPLDDVAWQAGNWYVNMHSIGIEHEGYAAAGATWYTESLYESSAALVRYLTRRFDIPRDRAHIIGHDQVPGPLPSSVAGMHWDPGPYWDWQHYLRLVGAPIGAHTSAGRIHHGDIVTVKPGFAGNRREVTGCQAVGQPCPRQGTNFVYLRQHPRPSAPLVTDVGLHPAGSPATTEVSDIGARAAAGQQLVVADRRHGWLKVWWLGRRAWLRNPAAHPVVAKSTGPEVGVRRGTAPAPVYGRAYPEQSAYPGTIRYETVTPLQYELRRGQAYALADASVPTDYYYAQTYDDSAPDDHTVVRGRDRYLQIWFGHRLAYVRAADVRVVR